MATTHATKILRHIRELVEVESIAQLPDRQLLERFTHGREQAAFAALVRRHGPLVLGVCRRVLHNVHDAEDAFQATFLMLARKADCVGRQGAVGGWLYQVAYRAALKVRASTARRQRHERQAATRTCADPLAELTGRELLAVLDEELQRLPESYRTPLVLCYLQGKTRDEASEQLGCSLSTLQRRLEMGRERLRGRLARRGLALPAALAAVGLAQGSASAVVPAALAATCIRSAVAGPGVATGASAQVLALTDSLLRSVALGKLKAAASCVLVVALFALGTGTLTHPASAQRQSADRAGTEPLPAEQTPPAKTPPAAPPEKPAAAETKEMTITGRVLDPDGKPVATARVVVLCQQGVRVSSWEGWASRRHEMAGRAEVDAEGRFRLVVSRTDPQANLRQVQVVAAAPGYGLAWKAIDPKAEHAEAEVRLLPEQVVTGRFVDLQGAPAKGVTIRVVQIATKAEQGQPEQTLDVPDSLRLGWESQQTDEQGRFRLTGLGRNVKLEMEIRDDRFVPEQLDIDTGNPKQAEGIHRALPPAHVVEGRVTYEDTGKGVPHARVGGGTDAGWVSATADAEGNYRLAFHPGNKVSVNALPPNGEPYIPGHAGQDWPGGAVVKQTINVKLPRGRLVHGRVTEAGSGKPVAGALVDYNGNGNPRAVCKSDGTFQLGVPKGCRRLYVTAPTPDYIPQAVGSAEVLDGKAGGDPIYFHAVVPLDPKPEEPTKEVAVTLRRGVTLRGNLVGPDGKPVKDAVFFVSGHRPPYEKAVSPTAVHDGRFELPGCDPEKSYRLLFLEHAKPIKLMMTIEALHTYGQLTLPQLLSDQNKLGAVVEMSGKDVSTPRTVMLKPCGSARLRFVDAAGKPLAKYHPWLQLVVTPGLHAHQAIEEGKLAAEVICVASHHFPVAQYTSDDAGRITLPGLIPGATYRIKQNAYPAENLQEFTVETGKTVELDVVVK